MSKAITYLSVRFLGAGSLHTAAAQLQTYLCDINELTKLEDPTLRTQIGRVDIPALLEDLREEWSPRAAERGLALSVVIKGSADDSRFKIGTDEARLRQIVANLVSNALKYTRQGSIVITAALPTDAASGVVVGVADTGIGIESRFLEKIFEPYVRLENLLIGRSDGSGLGLSIVKRLVESIGGSIRVESEPGNGTRFVVTVPGQC